MAAFTYILANRKHGVLYVGVTNDLARRVAEHKSHAIAGFTNRYNVDQLVWFESSDDINEAIATEKKIKHRTRQWKIDLIERTNPEWKDLSADWDPPSSSGLVG